MKTNDLYTEYARVIEMCKGTALEDKPWKCVKKTSPTFMFYSSHPAFNENEQHEFAVAILEDKPVFIGDELYHIPSNKMLKVKCVNDYGRIVTSYNMDFEPKTLSLDFAIAKPRKLRRIILEDTGETRPPEVGEYIRTDASFTKCRYPDVLMKKYEIWLEVKP